jgi:RNA recognition motif-containing protein
MYINLEIQETNLCNSESTSIPVNPRTNRPVGYAFVDLKTAEDAEKAISNLSGNEILERKVSVQLARKPDQAAPTEPGAEGADGERKRSAGRGRGRGRGRGGRTRGGARVSHTPRDGLENC